MPEVQTFRAKAQTFIADEQTLQTQRGSHSLLQGTLPHLQFAELQLLLEQQQDHVQPLGDLQPLQHCLQLIGIRRGLGGGKIGEHRGVAHVAVTLPRVTGRLVSREYNSKSAKENVLFEHINRRNTGMSQTYCSNSPFENAKAFSQLFT